MTPTEIRAWATRCDERREEGFGVGVGEPAKIVADALRLYAHAVERTKIALVQEAQDRLLTPCWPQRTSGLKSR